MLVLSEQEKRGEESVLLFCVRLFYHEKFSAWCGILSSLC